MERFLPLHKLVPGNENRCERCEEVFVGCGGPMGMRGVELDANFATPSATCVGNRLWGVVKISRDTHQDFWPM